MIRLVFILFLQVGLVSAAHADALSSLLASGRVTFSDIRGTGASSGASLTGTLVNETGRSIDVDVHILEPVYLRNSGAGQNMVATQVYGSNGGYYVSGRGSFVTIPANGRLPVMLIAYCADFERDNPGQGERLSVATLPREIADISRKIAAFEAARPNQDTVAAVQVALWLAQGWSPDDIRRQFDFSQAVLATAWSILK
jgi:hypothetical protein